MSVFTKLSWHSNTGKRYLSESEDSSDLSEDIKLEAMELLETLNIWYSERGGKPPDEGSLSEDEVNEVFRPLHTLKGLCQMGGISTLESLAHSLEDHISRVREGTDVFTQALFDRLGDVLRAFEQFFQHYPDEIPDVLAAEIASLSDSSDHTSEIESGADFGLDSDFESPVEAETSEVDDGSEVETGAETEPEAEAESETDAETCDDIEIDSSGLDSLSDADLTPTPEENLRFAEFCGRPENLIAALYKGDEYPDKESVKASLGYENLTRVVEIIYERTFVPEGTLIVFGSDLDAEMAGSLGNVTAWPLERSDLCLSHLDAPWSLVAFDSSDGAAVSEGFGIDGETPEPDESVAEVKSAPTHSGQKKAARAVSKEADVAEIPYEDFDATNSASNAAAMELDQEMLDDFLTNADELLDHLSQSMLELESDPGNLEPVEAIFRAAHTIKGTAGMFGFRAIEKLTHVMENTFDRIRKGELQTSSALMDSLLVALDRVRGCFESLKEGKTAELAVNEALNQVLAADYAAQHGIETSNQAKPAKSTQAPAPQKSANKSAETHTESDKKPVAGKSDSLKAQEMADPAKGQGKSGTKKKSAEIGTIRVDLGRLDALVNLVGELVIDRTRFARIEETLRASGQNSELLHTMSETLLLFGRHMNDVQSIIMKIRMVPVGNAFYKFTRVVRDLARTCGKEIDLVIEGGETELDKTLVEEIGDPLVHIIRNSSDHGIETPDVRIAAGKNPRGRITLRAYQDGNMIVIFISDDGKGLPSDKIRAKAIAVGLISENDQLSEKDIFNLIFEPGFSTAEKVTNISGRGVGMDAVKKSIIKLKGIVEVDSVLGAGTQITIKLPLTLAIIPSLLVESYGETYAIPLVNVIESIRINPSEVQRIGHSDFVKLRERVVPLLRLGKVFELENLPERLWYALQEDDNTDGHTSVQSRKLTDAHGKNTEIEEGGFHQTHLDKQAEAQSQMHQNSGTRPTPVLHRKNRSKSPRLIFVVVGVGEQRVGFIVDQLMGQQEIVIKSLGRILGRTRGVSGGCVLGNGRVALVLDVGELIEDHNENGKGQYRAASA